MRSETRDFPICAMRKTMTRRILCKSFKRYCIISQAPELARPQYWLRFLLIMNFDPQLEQLLSAQGMGQRGASANLPDTYVL